MRSKNVLIPPKKSNPAIPQAKKVTRYFLESDRTAPLVLEETNPYYEYFQNIVLYDFYNLLKELGIKYSENAPWIQVGKANYKNTWLLFISTNTLFTYELLPVLLPYLKSSNVPFRMVNGGYMNYRVNGGDFGLTEVGKMVTIFPTSISQGNEIIRYIQPMLQTCKGPLVEKSFKISNCLYAAYASPEEVIIDGKSQTITRFSVPDYNTLPFPISKDSNRLFKRRRRIGSWYVPTSQIVENAKGSVYEGTSLKWLRFQDCIIKEAKPYAVADPANRYSGDRLKWQYEAHQELKGKIALPSVYALFEQDGFTYLVLERIKGIRMYKAVMDILRGRVWKLLDAADRRQLLHLYREAVLLIEKLHSLSFLHRDITVDNFIIREDKLVLLDLEMGYNLKARRPFPPFLSGTPGYVAPEQLIYGNPSPAEDTHALAALLLSILHAGKPPVEVIHKERRVTAAWLNEVSEAGSLNELILAGLEKEPVNRPTISAILTTITNQLNQTT